MVAELLDGHPVPLTHREAVNHEEARFNVDGLAFSHRKFVAPVVNLRDQVFHLEAVERSQADQHLVEHYAQRPCVYFLAVAALFEELGAGVEGGPADAQVGARAVKDGRQPVVRDFCEEAHLSQVNRVEERLFLLPRKPLKLRLVREVKQDIGQLHVPVHDT